MEERFSGLIANVCNEQSFLKNAFKESNQFSDPEFILAAALDPSVHFGFLTPEILYPEQYCQEEQNNKTSLQVEQEKQQWLEFEESYKAKVKRVVCKMADKLATSPATSPEILVTNPTPCQNNANANNTPKFSWKKGIAQKRKIELSVPDDCSSRWDLFCAEMASANFDDEKDLLSYWGEKICGKTASIATRKFANLARYYGCMPLSSGITDGVSLMQAIL